LTLVAENYHSAFFHQLFRNSLAFVNCQDWLQ
jgi:hypothetical protein